MSAPRFSIIIPTYQRTGQLRASLSALSALHFPREDFEVIVVSDGDDGTLDADLSKSQPPLALSLLRVPHRGPAAARNAGAAQARGRYLVFTDDDCLPAADWLQAIDARITPERAVGGVSVNALPHNIYAATTGVLLRYLFAYYNHEPAQARFLSTNNLAVPAARFHTVGGFADAFTHAAGEDREFCARWREQGFALTFAPEIVVLHAHALNPASFWQQHFHYGRGAYQFRRMRARRRGSRLQFEPWRFYGRLLRAPFDDEHGARALSIAGLLLVAQCANAAGLALEYARDRAPAAPRRLNDEGKTLTPGSQ